MKSNDGSMRNIKRVNYLNNRQKQFAFNKMVESQQTLTIPQVVDILQKQQTHINELSTQLRGKDAEIQMLQTALSDLEHKCDIQEGKEEEIRQNIQLNVVEHINETCENEVTDTDDISKIDETEKSDDILVQINQEN